MHYSNIHMLAMHMLIVICICIYICIYWLYYWSVHWFNVSGGLSGRLCCSRQYGIIVVVRRPGGNGGTVYKELRNLV